MKIRSLLILAAFIAVVASCQNGKGGREVKLENNLDSASYALGVLIGENNKRQMDMTPGAKELNVDLLMAAMEQSLKGEEVKISSEDANNLIRNYFEGISKKEADKNLEAGKSFLETNKAKEGVVTLPSGLQYEILKEGNGPKPTAEDKVKCHYHGTTIDGKVFDSSVDRGEPAEFPVNGVIPGWVEALQLMPVGSKWKLYIPAELAYGERGAGADIGPNSALVFEVELLEIIK
ncbi:MAG: FKBP-type peptidyl-prolyl cis-trans isomerase [Prolixibacteraceae bacterium]|jgi:FKBP-type peptidyl-prolyl cis-trans isomerase|nr:FKBP-type peptidyl-prolyl cis-trans isomerase [Prolixibacteraceae bacterium]